MARKVILDVDTGVDDALALLLAARSPELEILGVTCVAGNTTLDRVVRNTLAVLELVGLDVPVAVGARKPLMAPLRTASYFHGRNGLADIELPPPSRQPVAEDAATFLVNTVRQRPHDVTVVAVGPLTNVALAVLRDAEFASLLAGLVIMGGAVSHPGNVSGAAEANISNDPEAAHAVVHAGADVQLVDLGATSQTVLPLDQLPEVTSDPVAGLSTQLLQFYGSACISAGASGAVLHDPLAVGLAALPDLATFIPIHLDVETRGQHSRGSTVASFSGLAPRIEWVDGHRDTVALEPIPLQASVARHIDAARFLNVFTSRLGLEP